MEALLGLFAASFAAATLFPLPSEAALFAYLQHYPDNAALAVAVATVGNTAGGMTSYLIGRFIPSKKLDSKAAAPADKAYFESLRDSVRSGTKPKARG